MAALETPTIFSNFSFPHPLSSIPKFPSSVSYGLKLLSVSPKISLKSLPAIAIRSAIQEIAVVEEETPDQSRQPVQRTKLFVLNLPWSYSAADLKNLFAECGTVADIEIIKQKNGKSRGFAFVTMSSPEEAQAVIDKYDSHELLGRIVRVELAKKIKKPSPPAKSPSPVETRCKLYVSNLAWKVRATHLREFFSTDFKPLSTRVVFESPTGRSAGYGFVSFASKEEAEAAVSALNGKELFGRPVSLKFSQKDIGEPEIEKANTSDEQPIDS